jgi:hypothetical protein
MKKLLLSLILATYIFVCNAQSPTITSISPASGAVGTLVTITGTNLTNPTAFSIGGTNAIAVSNNGTQLVGMVMPGATNGMATITTAGGTVSRGYFTVTATSFPNVQQGNKLVGTGAKAKTRQGQSLSISADGNTAIVGGPDDNQSQGAAWIYTRSGGVWTQQGNKLVGTGAMGSANQGNSVAISADGNTAIVGGHWDNGYTGAVWVYTRSGGVWTQQGSKLSGTGSIGRYIYQGESVSLSSDGNTAIVGGNADNNKAGAVWIFTRSGGVWSQQGNKLVGGGALAAAKQGSSVSISSDGNSAIVGGYGDSSNTGKNTGAAWVYTRSGGVWAQQGGKLLGTGAIGNSYQGCSVSISSDGNTAIVGGYNDNFGLGAAWIYARSGGAWAQQGNKLVGTGSFGSANQGNAVSLSADGNTAIVGGTADNYNAGAAWVFTLSGGMWTQQGSKLVGTGAIGNANQGQSVSLSLDGNTAIVGGQNDDSQEGAIWVHTRSGSVWSQQGNKLVGTGAVGIAKQGNSVSISADGNTAIVGGYYDDNYTGAVWVYTRSGGVWTQQGSKLVGTGATGKAGQGYYVSLSSDGNTAVVGGALDNNHAGAIWIFTRIGGVWTQQGNKLVGAGAIGNSYQGCSVSVSSDGNTAIVGGPDDNNGVGALWIYTRNGNVWTQQGNKLVGTGPINSAFQGWSVSLSSDGNTAIVGGHYDNNKTGAVWIYTRSGGVWSQQGSKLVGTGAVGSAFQGLSVSLSSDGNTAIAGGSYDNNNAGAVWIYTRSNNVWTQQGNKLVGTGAIGMAEQGTSVSISSDGNTALVGGQADNNNLGAIWIFTRSGGVWTQQGSKLVGTGAVIIGQVYQGASVCLSSDGSTAIVGGYDDNWTEGAAWIYTASPIVTSISQAEEKQTVLTIYPNPNSGQCTVQSDKEGTYSVMNPLGQTVQTFKLSVANSYTQNIDNIESGIYFIRDASIGSTRNRVVIAK